MASGTRKELKKAERFIEGAAAAHLLMESMDTFLVYGKPVLGHRLGITEIEPRIPSTPPAPSACARPSAMPRRWASFEWREKRRNWEI